MIPAALRAFPLFHLLDPVWVELWFRAAAVRPFQLGDILFRQGEQATTLFSIERGRIRILPQSAGGNETSQAVAGAGELLGDYALLRPHKLPASLRGAGTGAVRVLPLAPLLDAISARPEVRRELRDWVKLHFALRVLRGQASQGFMSPPSYAPLLARFETIRVAPSCTLQAPGLYDDRLFLIRSGEVIRETAGGEPPVILGPGDLFSPEVFYEGGKPPVVRTTGEVECHALSRDAFRNLVTGVSLQSLDIDRQRLQAPPWVAQQTANDCGLACLAMVARSHDLPVDLVSLRSRVHLPERGLSLSDLQVQAQALGYQTGLVRICPEQVAGVKLPAVAHLTSGHYVVLYGGTSVGVLLGDPASGVVQRSLQEFRTQWSGTLLLLHRPLPVANREEPC